MNKATLLLLLIAASLVAAPSHAFECANDGTAALVAPNDTADAEATACGPSAISGGFESTAVGNKANSEGFRSLALGFGPSATGSNSIAIGTSPTALGGSSIAIGGSAFTPNIGSIALGSAANATGADFGSALGAGSDAKAQSSTALGHLAYVDQAHAIVLGSISGVNSATDYASVGIGISGPQAPLHIYRDDATQEFLRLQSDEPGVPQDRAMMDLANNGGIRFQFANDALGTAWRFQAATGNKDRFEVTKVGSGQIEFWVDDQGNGFVAGDLDVGGNLTSNMLMPSDRTQKRHIKNFDPQTVLDKVAGLPLSTWEYSNKPGERHIGPMAQDFHSAFGFGSEHTSISVVDVSGVALASIQALNSKLERENRALRSEIEALKALESEVDDLRELVLNLVPQTAQN